MRKSLFPDDGLVRAHAPCWTVFRQGAHFFGETTFIDSLSRSCYIFCMPITLKRRDNESNERLLRRFSRRIQTSGLILRAKKRQYFESPKSDNKEKSDALRRLKIREKNEYLRKVGLLDEEIRPKRRGAGKKR